MKSARSRASRHSPSAVFVDQPTTGSTDDRWLSEMRNAVLVWFEANARQLPWRETRDPYTVWVSEIMLQQTQVATVRRYFDRFLQQFPDLSALAGADESKVLRAWEGLGYYRRARHLHAAARQVVDELSGRLPTDLRGWQQLPGIGRYTAGAVLSLALGQRHPIVEANTQRLYARLLALQTPINAPASQRALWDFADRLLPADPRLSRSFNLALMDIGSEVCQPRIPQCSSCPLLGSCRAAAHGLQSTIPGNLKLVQYEPRHDYAVVLRGADRQLWLRQCRADEEWGGLWDLPRIRAGIEPLKDPLHDLPAAFARQFGLQVSIDQPLLQLRHAVTRYRITLHVYQGKPAAPLLRNTRHRADNATGTDGRWFDLADLGSIPLHVTARRTVTHLSGEHSEANSRKVSRRGRAAFRTE